jgi:hypothetical protein
MESMVTEIFFRSTNGLLEISGQRAEIIEKGFGKSRTSMLFEMREPYMLRFFPSTRMRQVVSI